ncbi:hypothetical protein F6A13_03615 [Acidithiobacillus sp. 'AMD consortium']|uniref:hypothetical protein n=1 Tax=Acidithiobacillus sp. 'AMD consortium' TaxID=2614801 RepID=UPI00124CEF28|nr:hypothetical protein [Acidithiobacillus sp. 'AMD consortium']QFG77823.1 hypothetical protein F6A13_03615 [Acidithiobacillus sp. 'AMD consortium']
MRMDKLIKQRAALDEKIKAAKDLERQMTVLSKLVLKYAPLLVSGEEQKVIKALEVAQAEVANETPAKPVNAFETVRHEEIGHDLLT